jgi:hypothetical protein
MYFDYASRFSIGKFVPTKEHGNLEIASSLMLLAMTALCGYRNYENN